jgi:hypothetical protein
MTDSEIVDQGCGALMRLSGFPPASLHRFVIGKDSAPVPLGVEEIRSQLDDPFAQRLLADGEFPKTADALIEAFKRAVGRDEPQAVERSFLVGEGSQIPPDEVPFGGRTIRFVIALGMPQVDLIVSASSPASTSIEMMAWDNTRKGFNYYQTTADGGWVLAGNSIDAVREGTEGKGPFQSHTSGSFLMKELRFPWVHWHSFKALIDPAIFAGRPDLEGHRWVRERGDGDGTLAGADECEVQVAIPSVNRWTEARFAAIRSTAEPVRVARILEQVLDSPTVNLISSTTESSKAHEGQAIDLPPQFFVDSETLADRNFLDLAAPPTLRVPPDAYLAVMDEFNVRLDDDGAFSKPGDNHFAFVVPERAFEDIAVVKAATGLLLTRRLAACLLMVDFPNPVFSVRRAALLQRIPSKLELAPGPEAVANAIAEGIRSNAPEGSPEREFAALWDTGGDWFAVCNVLLLDYYEKLTNRLNSNPSAAFRDWFLVAESTRRHAIEVRRMPIFEFPLLLARSEAPEKRLVMRADATVAAA